MAFRVFLDVNVLLDFTLKRDSYEDVKKVMEHIISGDVKAYISPSVVQITAYWLAKAYGVTAAKEILLLLLADIEVIETDHATTVHALHSKMRDIEDALQYYTALRYKLDFFISRDRLLHKMSMPALPVYSPPEFLKILTQ